MDGDDEPLRMRRSHPLAQALGFVVQIGAFFVVVNRRFPLGSRSP